MAEIQGFTNPLAMIGRYNPAPVNRAPIQELLMKNHLQTMLGDQAMQKQGLAGRQALEQGEQTGNISKQTELLKKNITGDLGSPEARAQLDRLRRAALFKSNAEGHSSAANAGIRLANQNQSVDLAGNQPLMAPGFKLPGHDTGKGAAEVTHRNTTGNKNRYSVGSDGMMAGSLMDREESVENQTTARNKPAALTPEAVAHVVNSVKQQNPNSRVGNTILYSSKAAGDREDGIPYIIVDGKKMRVNVDQ